MTQRWDEERAVSECRVRGRTHRGEEKVGQPKRARVTGTRRDRPLMSGDPPFAVQTTSGAESREGACGSREERQLITETRIEPGKCIDPKARRSRCRWFVTVTAICSILGDFGGGSLCSRYGARGAMSRHLRS